MSNAPVGVFDSGIGGLSILSALIDEMPSEDFIYVSDSGHAPYGERDDAHVISRSITLARYLVNVHQIKALVVACNTATAAAIHLLRQAYPQLPVIGVEPALKPAAAISQTRRVGVMATRGTVGSAKFQLLLGTLRHQVEFIIQPCDGLADAIERKDAMKIEAYCKDYTRAMGVFGTQPGQIDTLVLGCTHYPFVATQLQCILGLAVGLIDSGIPVARQTRKMLLNNVNTTSVQGRNVKFFTTGEPGALATAAHEMLDFVVYPEGIEPPTLSLEG